jgi:outer membrane protein OmpA-like peptidoglycan-associated protein
MPEAGGQKSGNLSKRFVLSADGVGRQNILINNDRSIDLSVLFEPGSATLSDNAQALLNDLGKALASKGLDKATYLIGGHTDAAGDAEDNRKLSEQRAQSVKSYLVQRFDISPDRLAIAGYGENRPADKDNPDADINRRIEVSLVSTGYTAPRKRARTTAIVRAKVRTVGQYANRTGRYFGGYKDRQYERANIAYQGYRQLDDYNSSIAYPPTVDGRYGPGNTVNAVCDSFEGYLTDPRPQHMELDDYDARTPTVCPSYAEFYSTHTSGDYEPHYPDFSPEDDDELLK